MVVFLAFRSVDEERVDVIKRNGSACVARLNSSALWIWLAGLRRTHNDLKC